MGLGPAGDGVAYWGRQAGSGSRVKLRPKIAKRSLLDPGVPQLLHSLLHLLHSLLKTLHPLNGSLQCGDEGNWC